MVVIAKFVKKEATICDRGYTGKYSRIPISRTSRGNANWFEKSGVREIVAEITREANPRETTFGSR